MTVQTDEAATTITPLSGTIGAEVTGVDLRRMADPTVGERLNRALVEHIVLVIRGQEFTAEEFLAAVRLFGEPMTQNYAEHAVPGVPLISFVNNQFTDKAGNRIRSAAKWHTDSTNFERPPKYTALFALEMPKTGGGTAFCDMRAAYDALPARMRKRIDSLKTANVRLGSAVKDAYNALAIEAQKEKQPDPVMHPLVRTNPQNGRKALYFNPNKTEAITGMSPEKSQAFLDDLLQHALKPERLYTHSWRPGDMLIWDNRAAVHKANYDYDTDQRRLLYRACVKGERPA